MEPLLQALRIPYRIVYEEEKIHQAILDAYEWANTAYYHAAVVLAGSIVR